MIAMKINEQCNGMTLDELLKFYGVGKKQRYLIRLKNLARHNGTVLKFKDELHTNDVIWIDNSALDKNKFSPFPGFIDIVYEDDELLIINKAPFRLIHPDGNNFNTLCNAVSHYYETRGIDTGVYPVHRLDYRASGLIIFAKHFLAQAWLDQQFRDHLVIKHYYAITEAHGLPQAGVIDTPIAKDRHADRMRVSPNGQSAHTEYRVLEESHLGTALELTLTTGRRHQARVHLASINAPLYGDELYGASKVNPKITRIMLHATGLEFLHPSTLKPFKITVKPPYNLESFKIIDMEEM